MSVTKKKLNKGFTLIELLIVIVIIGLLAAVVIAAINPVETRNRAVDTGLKSDAAEVYNAVERYYASRGSYPWAVAPGNGSTVSASGIVPTLVTGGELKEEFENRQTLTSMLFYFNGVNNVKICFNPASTSFDEQAVYSVSGGFVVRGSANAATGLVCVPE